MILNNSPDISFIFDISLYGSVTNSYKDSENLPNLMKYADTKYPKNPIIGRNKRYWTTSTLWELMDKGYTKNLYKSLVINKLCDLFIEKVKNNSKRMSASKLSFLKTVIYIALSQGADGTVISISDRDLIPSGLKRTAARNTLKQLHDLEIIIYMYGFSYDVGGVHRTCPAGFMLWPYIDNLMLQIVDMLSLGKLSISELDSIKLGEKGTIVYGVKKQIQA